MSFNLWASVWEVQATPLLPHSDRHLEQPTELDEPISEVQSVEVGAQPEGPSRQEGSPTPGVELEQPHLVPTPRSGENIFCFAYL